MSISQEVTVVLAAIQGPPGPPGTASPTPELLTSATEMTFDFRSPKSSTKVITLTSDVTSSTAINATDGLEATFSIKTGAGGFDFNFPDNFSQSEMIAAVNDNNSAGLVLQQKWRYDLADDAWYALTSLVY